MIPILIIAFNQPNRAQVLAETLISIDNPIFLAVDGPRYSKEKDTVQEVIEIFRSSLGERIKKEFISETNQGCGLGPFSAISSAFGHTDRLIILEDDCIPDQSFFPYCEEMLSHHENDEHVMTISGSRFYDLEQKLEDSYTFSKFQHIWGWATWKRAWRKMDYSMRSYAGKVNTQWLGNYLGSRISGAYWRRNFQTVLDGRSDVWDYQWQLACWVNQGLCIQPRVNLIDNMGVDEGGTHSSAATHHRSLDKGSINFPLIHPDEVQVNEEEDRKVRDKFFSEGKIKDLVKYLIKK